MDVQTVLNEIRRYMNGPVSVSLADFGIGYTVNYGVAVTELKKIAEGYKGNHELALVLFQEDIRECKIIASLIADPDKVTGEMVDTWAQSFTNIEIVEQVCTNLLWKTDCALSRSIEWCLGDDELLQKAGLLIVARSTSRFEVKDMVFEPYIGIIENFSDTQIAQNKNTIKFALRQIANRTALLRERVQMLAQEMALSDDENRAWIGTQILFELEE